MFLSVVYFQFLATMPLHTRRPYVVRVFVSTSTENWKQSHCFWFNLFSSVVFVYPENAERSTTHVVCRFFCPFCFPAKYGFGEWIRFYFFPFLSLLLLGNLHIRETQPYSFAFITATHCGQGCAEWRGREKSTNVRLVYDGSLYIVTTSQVLNLWKAKRKSSDTWRWRRGEESRRMVKRERKKTQHQPQNMCTWTWVYVRARKYVSNMLRKR